MDAASSYAHTRVGETRRYLEAPLIGTLIERTERVAYLCDIVSGDEGKGHVGRLIDRLKTEYDVLVAPNVISARLEGILERRGFEMEIHFAREPFDSHVHCVVWRRT